MYLNNSKCFKQTYLVIFAIPVLVPQENLASSDSYLSLQSLFLIFFALLAFSTHYFPYPTFILGILITTGKKKPYIMVIIFSLFLVLTSIKLHHICQLIFFSYSLKGNIVYKKVFNSPLLCLNLFPTFHIETASNFSHHNYKCICAGLVRVESGK